MPYAFSWLTSRSLLPLRSRHASLFVVFSCPRAPAWPDRMSVHWKLLSISGRCLVDLHFEILPLLAVSFVSACLLFQILFCPLSFIAYLLAGIWIAWLHWTWIWSCWFCVFGLDSVLLNNSSKVLSWWLCCCLQCGKIVSAASESFAWGGSV